MNRLWGVIRIYLTRPLCWVLLAGIAVFLTLGWTMRSEKYENYDPSAFSRTAFRFFDYRKRVTSLDTLNAALEKPDGQPVALHYGRLARDIEFNNVKTNDAEVLYHEPVTKDQVAERLEQLEFPSRTRWLTTDAWEVRQSTIEQIGNVSSLEHVDLLISTSETESLSLSPLTKLVKLKSLNLGQITEIDSLAPLQALPNLKTLTVGNDQCVTAKNLREVAGIKSLEQLFLPDVTRNPVAMAALSELKLSSLKEVYVAIPPSKTAELQTIGSTIPNLRVRPSQYLLMRVWGCGGVLWAILMINLLGIHFLALFTVPAAELTPGYRVTQWRVAWTVMLGLILLAAGVMWSYKINLGLAVALSASALFASVSTSQSLQTRTKPAYASERWFGLLSLAAIAAVIGWVFQQTLEVDYLLAFPPWWVVGLLSLLAIFLVTKLNRRLNSVCRDRIASGNEPILSFFDMQEASLKLQSERWGDQVEPFNRIANAMVPAGLISLTSVLFLQFAPAYWFTPMIEGILQQCLPIIAFVAVWLILIKWWSRVPFFATMITRPPSRRSQIKQIFVGIASDFARAVPLVLAVAFLIGCRFVDKFGSAVETGFVILLLTAGLVGMCYAMTLVAITVRSTRWIIVTGFLVFSSSILFSGSIGYFGRAGSSWAIESGMFVTCSVLGVMMLAVSVAATILMWRRYHKIEWGSFLK